MKGFILAIVILAGILVIGGGAVAYKFMESHDGDSAVNKVMDKVSNSGSSDVVKEEVKENGQAGSGRSPTAMGDFASMILKPAN